MSRKFVLPAIISAAALAFVAAPAQAFQGDEASFTITVVIPPMAATMAAKEAGAVGAWTVFGQGGGFMVDSARGGSDSEMTLHYGGRNRVNLFSGGRRIQPVSIRDNGGLIAARFRADEFESIGLATSLVMVSAL